MKFRQRLTNRHSGKNRSIINYGFPSCNQSNNEQKATGRKGPWIGRARGPVLSYLWRLGSRKRTDEKRSIDNQFLAVRVIRSFHRPYNPLVIFIDTVRERARHVPDIPIECPAPKFPISHTCSSLD